MAHEIETHGDLAAFVASRTPAWHQLGTVVPSDLTVAEALPLAHLAGWDVRLAPAYAYDEESDSYLPLPGKSMTTRVNPFTKQREPLAPVSDDYTVWQNEEVAGFAEAIADEGLIVDAAGSLNGGKRIFLTFRTPEALTIPGTDDQVQPYLVLAASHDGMMAVTAQATSIRVVCANTLGAMLGQQTAQRYKAPHFGEGPEGRIADARAALGITFDSGEALMAEAQRWVEVELTGRQVDRILDKILPLDPEVMSAKAITRTTTARDSIRFLYEEAPTQENVRGTAWALLNATTEFHEWFAAPARDPLAVAQSRWVGIGATRRENAAKSLRQLIPALRA